MDLQFIKRSHVQRVETPPIGGVVRMEMAYLAGFGLDGRAATCPEVRSSNSAGMQESYSASKLISNSIYRIIGILMMIVPLLVLYSCNTNEPIEEADNQTSSTPEDNLPIEYRRFLGYWKGNYGQESILFLSDGKYVANQIFAFYKYKDDKYEVTSGSWSYDKDTHILATSAAGQFKITMSTDDDWTGTKIDTGKAIAYHKSNDGIYLSRILGFNFMQKNGLWNYPESWSQPREFDDYDKSYSYVDESGKQYGMRTPFAFNNSSYVAWENCPIYWNVPYRVGVYRELGELVRTGYKTYYYRLKDKYICTYIQAKTSDKISLVVIDDQGNIIQEAFYKFK